ncbi:YidH family protein [uncultured Aeromicrobium sp.]|uniref:YidH family protein n=1 Tax=uncultured Aeromicrobium sp. TaxID=337820 RepID=UPI0025FEC5B9|nr:DUF202 domain-containing protein [uncultured Aeromicrobium sp.]
MSPDDGRGRLARRLLPGGEEPDPRFTLANERTFLAWIRTALAFIAAGVALEAFADAIFPHDLRRTVSLVVVALGLLIALNSAVRWWRVENSLRRRAPLPPPALLPLLALGTAVAAGIVLALVLM